MARKKAAAATSVDVPKDMAAEGALTVEESTVLPGNEPGAVRYSTRRLFHADVTHPGESKPRRTLINNDNINLFADQLDLADREAKGTVYRHMTPPAPATAQEA